MDETWTTEQVTACTTETYAVFLGPGEEVGTVDVDAQPVVVWLTQRASHGETRVVPGIVEEDGLRTKVITLDEYGWDDVHTMHVSSSYAFWRLVRGSLSDDLHEQAALVWATVLTRAEKWRKICQHVKDHIQLRAQECQATLPAWEGTWETFIIGTPIRGWEHLPDDDLERLTYADVLLHVLHPMPGHVIGYKTNMQTFTVRYRTSAQNVFMGKENDAVVMIQRPEG